MMVNGAFFVPSGEGLEAIYDKASSVDPKSAALVDQLTMGAGVLGGPRYVRSTTRPRRHAFFLYSSAVYVKYLVLSVRQTAIAADKAGPSATQLLASSF
jgi:hypothetical protein